MKRKLAIAALALSMVVSNIAPSTAIVAHAEESDEIGDILDDVFGGNKPDNSQGEGTHDDNTAGGGLIEDNGGSDDSSSDNSGSNDNGGSDNSGSENSGSGNEGGNSGSDNSGSGNGESNDEDDDIGDILDDIFGGNKPDNSGGTGTTGGGTDNIDWDNMNKPQNGGSDNSGSNTGNTGNSGNSNSGNSNSGNSNSGNSNSGNSGSNAGSSTTVTDPDTGKTTTTTVNADGSTTVVTTDPATGETTSVIVSAGTTTAVDVTDPAILTLLPEAMIVTAPSGLPFVHALDVSRTVYSVWGGGQQLDAFYITDAAGTPVAMQAVDIVTAPDGKTYVNVTIDPSTVGATVQAAEEQRVSFAKHFGIDGVMINGTLADTFVALAS